MEDPRLRDRAPDLPGRGCLGALEPCEVGREVELVDVELAARPERLQAGPVARCERRQTQPDEHVTRPAAWPAGIRITPWRSRGSVTSPR